MNAGVDAVLEPLETIAGRGFSRFDVFRDWVDLMLLALQRDDERYLDTLDRYDRGRDRDRGERNADLFTQAFHELMRQTGRSNLDVLGMAYEEFGMQNDAFGQHFTPHSVAAAMTLLQGVSSDPEAPVTIADPACGSGRLLILAARQENKPVVCYGQDKDRLCAQMAALNLCFFNIDGTVVYGDSLTVEKRRAWTTRGTILGGEVQEVDPDEVAWPEAALEPREEEQAAQEGDVVAQEG